MLQTDGAQPTIIQWILSERVFTEATAVDRLQRILHNDALTVEQANAILQSSRDLLHTYHLDVRKTFSFEHEEHLWVLCNMLGDQVAQLATGYSADQIEYLKQLLRFIACSPYYQASTIDAMTQIASVLGEKDREDLIESLVESCWLVKTSSGKLMVGPRTRVELESYLREEELFVECLVCRVLVTGKNVTCSNGDCQGKVHRACLERMKSVDPSYSCAACKRGNLA